MIAVVHLVWGPLGEAPLRDFLASYRARPAGADHELVVLFNGVDHASRPALLAALEGTPHRLLELERPVLDLAAYGEAARRLEHERICFLNSYSVLLADGWLAKLQAAVEEPGVGAAGATGSYESHADWQRGPRYRWPLHYVALRKLRRDFPPYPNPHLRTNGMFLGRELACTLGLEAVRDKPAAYRLESGYRSITRQLAERGLRAVVVGRDGRSFAPHEWPASRTFRSGDQENVLIADNQTRAYQEATADERAALSADAWRRPVPPTPAPPGPALAALDPVAWTPGRPRLSVVIPTRDRFDALSETLAALEGQDCEPADVEVIVVDNAPDGATAARLAGRRSRLATHALVEPTPGPAAARNAGVRRAAAPVVLFLGDDTRPADPGVLAAHVRLHAEDPRPAAAVLGLIRWRPDRPVTPFMHWLEHGGPQFNFDALSAGPVSPARSFYTPHVSVKKAALEAVGGFDERFPFAALEDVELGLRLERAGLVLVYHPEMLVEHDHPYVASGFGARQERVGASARLMTDIHGDVGYLLGRPRWSWPAHRLARPFLEELADRPLRPGMREYVWTALAISGFATGWRRASEVLASAAGPRSAAPSAPR